MTNEQDQVKTFDNTLREDVQQHLMFIPVTEKEKYDYLYRIIAANILYGFFSDVEEIGESSSTA